ncbi:MAG: hypothetical protein Q8L81_10915 [Bacteroidota bacterium]|nr:hypothetical protein [Bacteroidota bacterium]
MIRLYIDNNVLSGIRGQRDKKFQLLGAKLKQIKSNITIIYSGAHIADLKSGYDENDALTKQRTSEDLSFISELTGNHCFISTLERPYIKAGHKDPFLWFEELVNEPVETYDLVKSLLGAFDGNSDPMSIEWKQKINQLINSPLDFKALGIDDPSILQMFGSGKTLGEAMTHMMNFYEEMQSDPEKYKSINKNASKALDLGTHISGIREDVFPSLDKTMSNKYGITVSSIIESSLMNQTNNSELTNWDRFINALSVLEVV